QAREGAFLLDLPPGEVLVAVADGIDRDTVVEAVVAQRLAGERVLRHVRADVPGDLAEVIRPAAVGLAEPLAGDGGRGGEQLGSVAEARLRDLLARRDE